MCQFCYPVFLFYFLLPLPDKVGKQSKWLKLKNSLNIIYVPICVTKLFLIHYLILTLCLTQGLTHIVVFDTLWIGVTRAFDKLWFDTTFLTSVTGKKVCVHN